MSRLWERSPMEFDCLSGWQIEIDPFKESNTACKHGREECAQCGTTHRRDALHTTVSGKGRIARMKGGRRSGKR